MFETGWILQRYVLREYLKVLLLSLSGLILIYLVVLFFQKMDTFVKYQAPFPLIFEYLLYKSPEVIFQWTLPYAVLLSTLMTLGNLSRHNEITAMKAGGISLYGITIPLFLFALLTSAVSFLGNEYLVPYTNQKTRHLLSVKVRKEEQTSYFKNYKIWYHGSYGIFNIQLLDPKERVLKGVTIYQFASPFRCIRRIDAREARWDDGKWTFHLGAVREFQEDGTIQTLPFKSHSFDLQEDWDTFQKIEQKSGEMSYTELSAYIKRIGAAGYDTTRYRTDLHAKLSFPFLNLVMVLIGIPFALRTGRSGGMALGIGASVVIGFTYGIFFYVFLNFGKSGILPPLLAGWTPTSLYGLAGLFALMSLRQ
ncbi:MAG: LPS export ABC transporter permease LptG [Desulfobacterota bacterium]|nr:LPS export ABC transporter permease LptG [Thermodesulfobacteriota bacterium]